MTFAASALLLLLGAQGSGPGGEAAGAGNRGGGEVSVQLRAALLADIVPKQDAAELRPQLSLSIEAPLTSRMRARFDARTEALVADRSGFTSDATARVTEAWLEMENDWADVRVGLGRLTWGRLDEISPADVVNPIDATRFLLEGRSEARLPVALVRGRLFPSDRVTIEGLAVPVFARGTFDELDEPSSPFNLVADTVLPAGVVAGSRVPVQREPETAWRNMSGGGRVHVSAARADLTASIYRGFDSFGPITFEVIPSDVPLTAVVGRLVEHHPRFTMVAGDVEMVTGAWAWRAEVVGMPEKTLAARSRTGLVEGKSFDAGGGFDRRAGDLRIYGSVVVHHEWSADDAAAARTDVNLIGSVERPFDRDRYLARAFAVVNPKGRSTFLRGVLRWRATDRAALEGSGGAFFGESEDRIGQFADRDFAFVRFTYDF